MILGMTTSTFTLLHVLISLLGIGSGFVVMYGLLTANRMGRLTAVFLATTALTSISGFAFPNEHITPGIAIGILSLVFLGVALVARYVLRMRGVWRWIFVVTALVAQYFNCFVLVAQSFEKVPALRALAPTQKEPPFAIAQLLVLTSFVVLTIASLRRFRLQPAAVSALPGNSRQKGAA